MIEFHPMWLEHIYLIDKICQLAKWWEIVLNQQRSSPKPIFFCTSIFFVNIENMLLLNPLSLSQQSLADPLLLLYHWHHLVCLCFEKSSRMFIFNFSLEISYIALFRIKFSIKWYINWLPNHVKRILKMNNYFIRNSHQRAYLAKYQSKAMDWSNQLKLIGVTNNSGLYNCWKFQLKIPFLSNSADTPTKRRPSFITKQKKIRRTYLPT